MKPLATLFISFLFLVNNCLGQINKTDQKIEQYYIDNKFYKILSFKQRNNTELSARSLFYKGMSAFMLKHDAEALAFYNASISKDNQVSITHYQRGITLVFLKDNHKAIEAFNKAIALDPKEPKYHIVRGDAFLKKHSLDSALLNYQTASKLPNCSPSVFMDIGYTYGELGLYEKSRSAYATALKYFQPNTKEYDNINYNIGFAQQMNEDYMDAKATYELYLLKHPNDFGAMAKLIQINYELNNIETVTYLQKKLYSAYGNKQLRGEMRDKYCIDQFYWNNHLVFGYEYFENSHTNSVEVSHIYQIIDKNENLICELQLELDSLNNNSEKENTYYLCIVKDDLHQKFGKLPFNDNFDYSVLKSAIINILNDEAEPTEELEGYAEWCRYLNKDYHFGYDGSSFVNAVVASSVPFEFGWIKENFPEINYKSQALFFHEGKPFDILVFEDEDGKRLEFYFDISAFHEREK